MGRNWRWDWGAEQGPQRTPARLESGTKESNRRIVELEKDMAKLALAIVWRLNGKGQAWSQGDQVEGWHRHTQERRWWTCLG